MKSAIFCILLLSCSVQEYGVKIETQIDYSYWRPAIFGSAAAYRERSVHGWDNDITNILKMAIQDASEAGGIETFKIRSIRLRNVHIRPYQGLDSTDLYFKIMIE